MLNSGRLQQTPGTYGYNLPKFIDSSVFSLIWTKDLTLNPNSLFRPKAVTKDHNSKEEGAHNCQSKNLNVDGQIASDLS